ncbi:MAG: hypothetical protein Q8P81_01565 [Nanoarchaeota archaeon]|nr:hypothetical protein [Nanoarchaeota archaeon]
MKEGRFSRRAFMLKNGQVEMSFGMIFSIILIVVFFAFAFYAIKTFLKINDSAQSGQFISDLQSDIDGIWRSVEGSQEKEYSLSAKIERVCFVDFDPDIGRRGKDMNIYPELSRIYHGNENLVFYPVGSSDVGSARIENINIVEITLEENPFCIDNLKGVQIKLIKNSDEALVRIERQGN